MCYSVRDRLARFGSSEQRLAFFRLLVSLLKRSQEGGLDPNEEVPKTVAQAAYGMLYHSPAGCTDAVTLGSETQMVSGGLWLLVLGRCCLQWAAALEQVIAADKLNATNGTALLFDGRTPIRRLGSCLRRRHAKHVEQPKLFWQLNVMQKLFGWLAWEGRSLRAALSAAGYYGMSQLMQGAAGMSPLMKCASALNVSYRKVMQTRYASDEVLVLRVDGLTSELETLGRALSMFAVRFCCNNPRCCNTSGLSEKAVVTGKGCLCAGCEVARYCSKSCQAAHWGGTLGHKPVCHTHLAVQDAACTEQHCQGMTMSIIMLR
jgi:hypothetical protein